MSHPVKGHRRSALVCLYLVSRFVSPASRLVYLRQIIQVRTPVRFTHWNVTHGLG